MKRFSKDWWKHWFCRATIRAIHTFCQTLGGFVLVDTPINNFRLLELDWGKILLVCLISGIISYAKSFLVGVPEVEEE